MDNHQIIELLESHGLIDQGLAQDILAEVNQSGKEIAEILADFQVIQHRDDIWPLVATELGTQMVDIRNWTPPEALLALVPAGTARLHGALPIQFDETGLSVALVDPLNPQTVEDLRFALGREIHVVVAPDYLVEAKINDCYGGEGKAMEDILASFELGGDSQSAQDLESEANSAPIIRYVDLVLYQAIKEKASDIHFEPFEKDFKIRYRVDGALYEMAPPPVHLALPILSRVKVMANMNIAERRIPQDGRIVKQVGDKQVDMRVSSLPTHHGESIVLRVLDRSSVNLSLENLGLPDHIFDYIGETIEKPNGIFIVTGPTGAGKTTTLYAALRRINTIDSKLLTAEDPVEYDIDGIIQIPINEAIGLDFPRVLRAFLRQDPDRIMIGEMRDKETATIGIQAALTGHLVLSTLHTNDSAGAVTRLIDMGCEPFLVAASLEGVLAQRLVRTICKDCKSPYEPNEAILSQLGISAHELGDKQFSTGAGCDSCGQTGYRGRRGLYELLNITDPIRELITGRAPTVVIKQKAVELGMNTLREDGLRNIYLGNTTIEEVLKYT
ncbi:MAG: type II/IV secretion system protein [Verrucomicrobiaceae bacterium]|nr:MAG: type II/IV secretion system protein [Verrucomicrobiaceae bacterium]